MTTWIAVLSCLSAFAASLWALSSRRSAQGARDEVDALNIAVGKLNDEVVGLRQRLRDQGEAAGPAGSRDVYRAAGGATSEGDRIGKLVAENAALRTQVEVAQSALAEAKAIREQDKLAFEAIAKLEHDHSVATLRQDLERSRLEVTVKQAEADLFKERYETEGKRLRRDNQALAQLSPAVVAEHFSAQIDALEEEQTANSDRLVEAQRERDAVDAKAPATEVEEHMKRREAAILDARILALETRQAEIPRLLEEYAEIVDRARALQNPA